MLKHNFRTIDTPNADSKLTPDNEHLSAVSVDDGMRRYREALPDKVRKNAVHANGKPKQGTQKILPGGKRL